MCCGDQVSCAADNVASQGWQEDNYPAVAVAVVAACTLRWQMAGGPPSSSNNVMGSDAAGAAAFGLGSAACLGLAYASSTSLMQVPVARKKQKTSGGGSIGGGGRSEGGAGLVSGARGAGEYHERRRCK